MPFMYFMFVIVLCAVSWVGSEVHTRSAFTADSLPRTNVNNKTGSLLRELKTDGFVTVLRFN